jgi:hypothetical protein
MRCTRCALAILLGLTVAGAATGVAPVRDPLGAGFVVGTASVTNLYSQAMLLRCVEDGGKSGLSLDLSRELVLLDGTSVDPERISGRAWIAPYPLSGSETRWDSYQFLASSYVRKGRALLDVGRMRNDGDAGWDRRGQIVVRLDLSLAQDGPDRSLGIYEFLVGFSKDGDAFRKAPTVTEGPIVGPITSEDPGRVVISLRTDPASDATIDVWVGENPEGWGRRSGGAGNAGFDPPGRSGPGREARSGSDAAQSPGERADVHRFRGPAAEDHEIVLTGLRAGTDYLYRVEAGGWTSGVYSFRTAPPKGEGSFRFAFAGDSRAGVGGGARSLMGVNGLILDRLLPQAWDKGAAFWIHGGDFASGYTTVPEDFHTQLRAFKWVAASFLHERPIYAAMGNHDALIRAYDENKEGGGGGEEVALDRWPYEGESSEAVFADEWHNPRNGPEPVDPRRPPLRETVYAFQYGTVLFLVLNNNYWVSTDPERFGGCPEGWIFPEQMAWLARELDAADADRTVRHVLIVMHEPAFPNGTHIDDAMWYEGDNRVRARSADPATGDLRPDGTGLVEVRNDLARLAARSRKVVAFLTSDEHNYSRILITPDTPAGDPARDDRDGDGRIDPGGCSVIPGLRRPVWYLVSGGAGAPSYPDGVSPWNSWCKAHVGECRERAGCYRFSILAHWLLFDVDGGSIGLEVYSDRGELIDRVEDLSAVAR